MTTIGRGKANAISFLTVRLFCHPGAFPDQIPGIFGKHPPIKLIRQPEPNQGIDLRFPGEEDIGKIGPVENT